MANYQANSTNSTDFTFTKNDIYIGKLKYDKWYSLSAEIFLTDNARYRLEPKGFWGSKIELKENSNTLLVFELGWKGIVIKTLFGDVEKEYLLKLKGLLSSKFILIDTEERTLLAADADFRWTSFSVDYYIETSNEFDDFDNKELLLLTVVHCINYYVTFVSSVS